MTVFVKVALLQAKKVLAKIRQNLFPRFECAVCNKRKKREEMVAQIEESFCCLDCATEHNHPGKFELYSWDEDYPESAERMGKALILYSWAGTSSEDDCMHNDGWGTCFRFGRYLLIEGQIEFHEFASAIEAEKQFSDWYNDGWGASEWDAYISDDRGEYCLSVEGEVIGVYPRLNRARAAMRIESAKSGYYPALWYDNERGNLTLLSY